MHFLESRNADVWQKSFKWQVKKYLSPCLGSDSLNTVEWQGVAVCGSAALGVAPCPSQAAVLTLVNVGVLLSGHFPYCGIFYPEMGTLLVLTGQRCSWLLLLMSVVILSLKVAKELLQHWDRVLQHFMSSAPHLHCCVLRPRDVSSCPWWGEGMEWLNTHKIERLGWTHQVKVKGLFCGCDLQELFPNCLPALPVRCGSSTSTEPLLC